MDPRFPIGKFEWNENFSAADRTNCIEIIRETPAKFRAAVTGLTEKQLDTPYREGGWTLRQVIHHLPDSHTQAYIRTKLALTEERPTIKPYVENEWAKLADTANTRVGLSVEMLELIHERWLNLLNAMKPADFERDFVHPQFPDKPRTIDWIVALYAWHGAHHIGHLNLIKI